MSLPKLLLTVLTIGIFSGWGINVPRAAIIDFENQPVGSLVKVIQSGGINVNFSSNVTDFGLGLITSSSANTGNATTSGTNYLGVNDGFSELFIAGDRIDLEFSQPINELIVSFITGSNTAVNALEISNGFDSVFNALPTGFLGLDEVFTFGLSGGSTFTQVSLIAAPGTLVSFNIDDIQFNPVSTVPVPTPSAFVLMLTGLCSYLSRTLPKCRSLNKRLNTYQFQHAAY